MTDIPMRELCDSLAAGILKICEANNTKIACAESLTGGLLADAFVRIPGASNVLLGSAVTYDINAKASILHVDKALLDREGAVHPEIARQMAVGTARLYSQPEYGDRIIGLSTTGVAGPDPEFLGLMPDYLAGITLRGLAVICADLDGKRQTFLLEAEHVAPQASPRTMPKCSKPSNSILMACAKRFVASPYSTFCKT